MERDSEVVMRIENVTKDFYLPHYKSDSLKRSITQAFKPKDKTADIYHALKGVSFEVRKGDFFGVLGRNGAGKSTLLKIMSEIYQPSSGSVSVKGKLVPFIELGVGFNTELSGRENVYLNGALLGFSRVEIDQRYDDIVKFAELENFMEQKLKNYSSGMKVRLAFSVAIQAEADILLLDEVLAVGDADFQKKCYEYFNELKDNEKTIIFVTHSMGAVKNYCNKAILIEDGKITHHGDSDSVADRYLELFAQSKHQNEGESLRFGDGGASLENISVDVTQKTITVTVDYSSDDVESKTAAIGIDFQDSKRRLVGGVESSTSLNGIPLVLEPGKRSTCEFKILNQFGTGDYSLTVSLKESNNQKNYDFWKRAAKFSNINEKDRDSYFPVVLEASMRLKSS